MSTAKAIPTTVAREEPTMIYQVQEYDTPNGETYIYQFNTTDERREWLNNRFGLNKDAAWFDEKPHDRCLVEEHDGKLYAHWVRRTYNDYDTLFSYEKKPNSPRTIPELLEHLECGQSITLFRGTRAPLDVVLVEGYLN